MNKYTNYVIQNALILVTINIFCLKCTRYHLLFWINCYNNLGSSKTEKSGRANALIFKNTGKKLQKDSISRTRCNIIYT